MSGPFREPSPPEADEDEDESVEPDLIDGLAAMDRALDVYSVEDCTRILLAFAVIHDLPIVLREEEE